MEKNNTDKTVKTVCKKRKLKGRYNNLYLYIQIIVTTIFVLSAVILKSNDNHAFYTIKEDYTEFFTTETVADSKFSYNSFFENLVQDIEEKYHSFVQVVSNFRGKGKSGLYPSNVSMEKYIPQQKGTIPVNGIVTSEFGIRKDPFNKKKKDFHTGMDIAAAKGTYIKAAFDGTVSETGKNDIAGNYVKITSDNQLQTFYCHSQFIFVSNGDKIRQGQVIATVGDTGQATGPHLHFEVIFDGNRVNPCHAVE